MYACFLTAYFGAYSVGCRSAGILPGGSLHEEGIYVSRTPCRLVQDWCTLLVGFLSAKRVDISRRLTMASLACADISYRGCKSRQSHTSLVKYWLALDTLGALRSVVGGKPGAAKV